MTFQSPAYLFALLAVPVAVAGYLFLHRRRGAVATRFASTGLFPNLVERSPRWRRHVPPAVLLVALVALLVGLARPHARVPVKSEEATVVLAIDASRSMGATDVLPTRLEAVKVVLGDFLRQVPTKYRVGVVAFASDADVVAPATRDREAVRAAIAELRPGEGTALGDAIVRAVALGRGVAGAQPAGRTERDPPPTSILLLSDGAQEGGRVESGQAARLAKSLGIPVYTVAFGTPNGVVEVPRVGGFVERIRVPPDPDTLRRVAATTGGRFFAAPGREALASVYRELGSRLGSRKERREITVAFAAGGALLMLAGGALSALWFRRLP